MFDTKSWFQSRTIWAALVALLFTGLRAFGLIPEGLTEGAVVDAIVAVATVLAIVFRAKATVSIGPNGT